MQEKRWRILWIDNQASDVERSDAQLKSQQREEQTNITSNPYIRSLEDQGYDISLTNTIAEGVTLLQDEEYHAVLLNYDEATREENRLSYIRSVDAHIPIILLTHAGGREVLQQASLYDVDSIFITTASHQSETSSQQLEASLAFILEKQTAREAYTPQAYVQNFNKEQIISTGAAQRRGSADEWQTWIDTYVRLVEWDLRLDTLHNVDELKSIHEMEKREANARFADYIQTNYHNWLTSENVAYFICGCRLQICHPRSSGRETGPVCCYGLYAVGPLVEN